MLRTESRLPLNAAQLRNMQNWPVSDWCTKTILLDIALTRPRDVTSCVEAVREWLSRHEALRSRLYLDSAGRLAQEVVTTGGAMELLDLTVHSSKPARLAPDAVDPMRHAATCAMFQQDGRVVLVKACVSHFFVDELGAYALRRDLQDLLDGSPTEPAHPHHRTGPSTDRQDRNTAYWKELLRDAPRACTYAAVPRDAPEQLESTRLVLPPDVLAGVTEAARASGTTPYAVWVGVASSVAGLLSGAHRQVFRSTYSNRFGAVQPRLATQQAQAVFLPLHGSPTDSLGERIREVSRLTLRTLTRGAYDAPELLRWINDRSVSRGVAFQPAFEINYISAIGSSRHSAEQREVENFSTTVTVDPRSAKADFSVLVLLSPVPTLQVSLRSPLSSQYRPVEIAEHCLAVVRELAGSRDIRVADLPVPVSPAVGGLFRGHHSGAAVDLAMTERMIVSIEDVASCSVEVQETPEEAARAAAREKVREVCPASPGASVPSRRPKAERPPAPFAPSVPPESPDRPGRPGNSARTAHGGHRLVARVTLRRPVSEEFLWDRMHARQPRFSGAAVPDQIVLAPSGN